MRSAIVGAVLALVDRDRDGHVRLEPHDLGLASALYGWNWDYQLLVGLRRPRRPPAAQITRLLDHDPYVGAWSGIYFGSARSTARPVPIIGATPGAAVAPPLLSGHGLSAGERDRARREHPRRAAQARRRHRVGQCRRASRPRGCESSAPRRCRRSVRAGFHTTMGTGAVVPYQLIPAAQRNLQGSPVARTAGRARAHAAVIGARRCARSNRSTRRSTLRRAAAATARAGSPGCSGRPRSSTTARWAPRPPLLGVALGVGALGALALTLARIGATPPPRARAAQDPRLHAPPARRGRHVAVDHRDRDRDRARCAPGHPRRSRVVGRRSRGRSTPSRRPTVPVLTIVAIGAGALVLAVVVALVPGWQAARTPTAPLLREQ